MKHDIIKTENYLLVVDDSEIKEGDWYYLPRTNSTYLCQDDPTELEMEKRFGVRKVIAHLPLNNSPILQGVDLLLPLEQEDDVEKLANDLYPDSKYEQEIVEDRKLGFISGYNKAKERYKFTEEDMRKAIEMSRDIKYVTYSIDEIIQSLSQPKMPTHFECDTVCDQCLDDDSVDSCYCHYGSYKIIPKTTTNSQGQTVWVGTYIFP